MGFSGNILFKKPLLLFLLFLVVAYLPVFLPFFHLKNDLISQNLPTRFVISESLYSGYFPWWNPYIHFGIPQYGDMNNGFWNPFIWLISLTTGYNIWTITLEEMIYVLLGGWGIYKVVKEFLGKETALLAGLSYMACGYMIGHLQHFCWITGTAYFPYVLLFYIRVHQQPLVKNFIFGAFSMFCFLASTHPGLIIGSLYFFLFFTGFILWHRRGLTRFLYSKNFWFINLIFLVAGILCALVVIASNVDVLGHISRGEKLSRDQMLLNPTSLQSYLSLLFPLPVHKSAFFETDISMRNNYIGLACLIGLLIFVLKSNAKLLLSAGLPLIFFILLAAGDVFKILFSKIFPLVGYVRMNGEFSYFASLILIVGGAAGMQEFLKNERTNKRVIQLLQWIFGLSALGSLVYLFFTGGSYPINSLFSADFKKGIKTLVDGVSFTQLLLVDALLQFGTITLLRKYSPGFHRLLILLLLNFAIHCWLILPYTGLGMRSKNEFENTIRQFKKGIQAPELRPIRDTRYLDSSLLPDLWMLSSYSKKIGYLKEEFYPVQLKNSQVFFRDSLLFDFIKQQSYLFLSADTVTGTATSFDSSHIMVTGFGPGYLKARVSNRNYHYLTFLQNDYPYWKLKLDGQEISHFTGFTSFLTAPFPEGDHEIEYRFDPYPIRRAAWGTAIFFLLAFIMLFNSRWRNKKLFTN